jgi:uncharacterized protein YkwD
MWLHFSKLTAASKVHTDDMATNDFLGLQGSDGSTFSSRAIKSGFEIVGGAQLVGAGYSSPDEFLNAFKSKSILCL